MRYFKYKLTIVAAVLTCVALYSCRTKYVTVPEYHTEYKTVVDSTIKWDSVFIHDSVAVLLKGDTVTKYQLRDKVVYKYLLKQRIDTLIKTDSIRVPYPVERQLTKWEKVKMDVGGYGLVIIVLVFMVFMLRFLGKLHARS